MIFHAYGDESCTKAVVVYGVICLPSLIEQSFLQAIIDTKQHFGGKAECEIHCRTLFHPKARSKSAWRHLDDQGVADLMGAISKVVRSLGFKPVIGVVERKGLPEKMPDDPILKGTQLGEKQLAQFAYMAAVAPFVRYPGLKNLKLWVDVDRTRIEWPGRTKRRRGTPGPVGFDLRGIPSDAELRPEPWQGRKPALLEIADLVSYVSARALGDATHPFLERFRDLYDVLAPAKRAVSLWPMYGTPP